MANYDYAALKNPAFFDNPEQRLACMLVLDTSGSMGYPKSTPINELNAGLDILRTELLNDPVAKKRVEIATVTFGGTARVQQPFATIDQIPRLSGLSASGFTPMAEALTMAMDLVEQRHAEYVAARVPRFRPWVWLITDGHPDTSIASQQARLLSMEAQKRALVFTLGVDGADFKTLEGLSAINPPLKLKDAKFTDLFKWLSASLSDVSNSQPGDKVEHREFPKTIDT